MEIKMKISQKAKEAVFLGTLCSVSYLAVYIARNVLGAVTPKMIEGGFTLDYIGQITAIYLLAYACGQLINGFLGDHIKAKYMISFGLLSAGAANFVFVMLSEVPGIAVVAYGWTGFSLSMIYGPMTKVVADSTELIYATRCSLGYTFASFLGSPSAGLLATFLSWQAVFNVSSAALVLMAVICFMFFRVFEKKGIVKYRDKEEKTGKVKKDYAQLFGRGIVRFSLISMVTGVIRTSLVSFLSTYFYEHLGYSEQSSASVFSVATLVIASTAFIAVFIYERLGRNMNLSTLLFFVVAAIAFTGLYFITNPIMNICVIVIAIMAGDAAATMLWSVYCPSLCDTGLVSGITGFLDFLSYAAAALASLMIPKIVAVYKWNSIILIMAALMFVGAAICLPYFLKKKETE